MRRERVIVRIRAGPAWKSGPPEDQPGWPDHERFVDDLVDRGTIVMGGPFSDFSGSMVIVEGLAPEAVRRLLDDDPFVQNGVFEVDDVRAWTLYVDRLTSRA
ncbi:MAG: YciI family protein [Actinomycetota bacterium]|nr:YciI family protein [Actinomycetota bacterium]